MGNGCKRCGSRLPVIDRLSGKSICAPCIAKENEQLDYLKVEIPELLNNYIQGQISKDQVKALLVETIRNTHLDPTAVQKIQHDTFRSIIEGFLADEVLTKDEDEHFSVMDELLDLDPSLMETEFRDLSIRLFVARVNDGRVPEMKTQRLLPKQNETVHLEMTALLLKHVPNYVYERGYSGFSFPLGKGIRYHIGGSSGQSVFMGLQVVEDDRGVIFATSHRFVFLGNQKTLELPYSKIISFDVFEDGIRIHVSNRQTAFTFRLESGHPVAAIINNAVQVLGQENGK